jgi:hypothetical protein
VKAIGEVMRDPSRVLSRPADMPPGRPDVVCLNDGTNGQPPLYLTPEEIGELGYVRMANRDGVMVWVSPLGWRNGIPYYPSVDLPPGDKRRAREAAMDAEYRRYREATRAQRSSNGGTLPGFDDD